MALFRIWLVIITIVVVVVAYKINSLEKLTSWPFLCYNKRTIKIPLICRAGKYPLKLLNALR